MQQKELSKILRVLQSQGVKGVGILSLSQRTGIPAKTLRLYLPKYSEYFQQNPHDLSFQINRNSKFKGDVEAMLANHQKSTAAKSSSTLVLALLFLAAATTAAVTVFQ